MAGIRDVSREARVSIATVSYVLNNNKYVSEELSSRVRKAVEKLGYRTNPIARSLRKRKTKEVGIVLQNVKNVFFVQLLSGLEERLQALGYSLVFFDTNYDIQREKEIIGTLRNRWVDGIVLYSCVSEKDKADYYEFLTRDIKEKVIPIVSLDRTFLRNDIPVVTVDNTKGGFEATKHLILVGKRKILHITGKKDWEISIRRQEGYVQAIKEFGLDNIMIRNGNFRPSDGYEICKMMLSRQRNFDGIFAANDQMAIGCIKAIKEMGISIPNDIAVVGFDNIFPSTLIDPTLTTVNVPRHAMGVAAAELIIELMHEKRQEERILQTNLIVRQSTDIRGERNWDLYEW